MQNGFVERCNGNIRKELLNAHIFKTLDEFRLKAEEYKQDYNYSRPHSSLNYKTPAEMKIKKELCYYDVEMLISQTDENKRDLSIFQYPNKLNN